MKILVIVHFHEIEGYYRDPSPVTGLYGLWTEDESDLDFHGMNMNATPIGGPLYRRMEAFFFSEYRAEKFPAWRYLDRRFKPLHTLVGDVPDKIVVCEV